MSGETAGWALEIFTRQAAQGASQLWAFLDEEALMPDAERDPKRIVGLFNAASDAEGYLLLGDPAVRLRTGAGS